MTEQIQELRVLEAQLQSLLSQKQAIQIESNEIDNALTELKATKDKVYRIVSGIMLCSDKEKVSQDLKERKKTIEMLISSMEKQEKIIENRLSELKKDLTKVE